MKLLRALSDELNSGSLPENVAELKEMVLREQLTAEAKVVEAVAAVVKQLLFQLSSHPQLYP